MDRTLLAALSMARLSIVRHKAQQILWSKETGCPRFIIVRTNFALDLPFLFPYIDGYAHSPLPQMLRRLLQEVRPRRVKRNGRLPRQLDIRGVLDVRREAEIPAV